MAYLNGCSADVFWTALTIVIPIRYKKATARTAMPKFVITLSIVYEYIESSKNNAPPNMPADL